jgi:hypothetical protein
MKVPKIKPNMLNGIGIQLNDVVNPVVRIPGITVGTQEEVG